MTEEVKNRMSEEILKSDEQRRLDNAIENLRPIDGTVLWNSPYRTGEQKHQPEGSPARYVVVDTAFNIYGYGPDEDTAKEKCLEATTAVVRALKPFGEGVVSHFLWAHGINDFRIEWPDDADGGKRTTFSMSITVGDDDEDPEEETGEEEPA